jgi:transcriptional regulator with XRE-family HTH domain
MGTVGNRLRHTRESRAWTQRDLADRSGVRPLTILRIENGNTQPRLSTVRRLSEALGIDPGWLLFGEDDRNDAGEHTETPG